MDLKKRFEEILLRELNERFGLDRAQLNEYFIEKKYSDAILSALTEAHSLGAKESKWISVETSPPIGFKSIIVTNGHVVLAGGFYEGPDKFIMNMPDAERSIFCCDIEKFTLWQPLPALPSIPQPNKS